MKQTLLIITALMLVVGFSNAQTHEAMEFYDDGKPRSIETYKVSKDKIELVKRVSWYNRIYRIRQKYNCKQYYEII